MNEVLTATEVLDLLDLGRSTLTKWQKRGIITKHGTGKKVWYKRSEIYLSLAKRRFPKAKGELRINLKDPILTREEVLAYLNISSSDLITLQKDCILPYFKVSTRNYYLKSEVETAKSKIRNRRSRGRFQLRNWAKRPNQ